MRKARKKIGYFDIETADWTIFVVGGILIDDEIRIIWHDARSFVEALLESHGVEWRAHNGGRFDFILVLEWAQRLGYSIKTTMRGAGILKAIISDDIGRTVTFVDTYALAPVNLEDFAACAGKTLKGEYDHNRTVPWLDMNSPTGIELEEYLRRDLLSLRDADEAWRAIILQVTGTEPSLTIGGTAWKSAVKYASQCGEDVSKPMSEANYHDGRAGYYGGRVEVFRQFADSVYTCDRNSSYPAALTLQPVPCGHRKWGRTLEGDGTVWAAVHVPESFIPPLPLRWAGDRLAFPVGTFDGVWTALELRNAMKLGVKVLRIHKSRMAEKTTGVLGEWCQKVWNARVSIPAWSKLLKLLANSLTGKLAQQPERESLSYDDVSGIPRGARQITEIDRHGKVWFTETKIQVSPCARPEWSAYLTSEARIELLAQLRTAEAVYCDTDSVFSLTPLTRNIGNGLGQWKDEGIATDWESWGPKFYRYDKGEKQISKVKGQSGISRDGFDALVLNIESEGGSGSPWARRAGANSLKRTIRDGGRAFFSTQNQVKGGKRVQGWVGARLVDSEGLTRAPTIRNLVTRFGSQD